MKANAHHITTGAGILAALRTLRPKRRNQAPRIIVCTRAENGDLIFAR